MAVFNVSGKSAPNSICLLVENFCKNFGKIGAFSNVSFAVQKGQCFGLLGANNAGKTALFKCLIGEELPANGNAHMRPHTLLGSFRNVRADHIPTLVDLENAYY